MTEPFRILRSISLDQWCCKWRTVTQIFWHSQIWILPCKMLLSEWCHDWITSPALRQKCQQIWTRNHVISHVGDWVLCSFALAPGPFFSRRVTSFVAAFFLQLDHWHFPGSRLRLWRHVCPSSLRSSLRAAIRKLKQGCEGWSAWEIEGKGLWAWSPTCRGGFLSLARNLSSGFGSHHHT